MVEQRGDEYDDGQNLKRKKHHAELVIGSPSLSPKTNLLPLDGIAEQVIDDVAESLNQLAMGVLSTR